MPTKTSHGKNTSNSVADIAAKVTEESEAPLDDIRNTAAQATADTQAFLASNQETLEKNFAIWQEYHRVYANFILTTAQQILDQSLAFRESWDKVLSDNVKKAQAVSEQEQQIILEATKLFQAQTQIASESAKVFTTNSKVMITTALFSDWAAERVAKMFTTISAN